MNTIPLRISTLFIALSILTAPAFAADVIELKNDHVCRQLTLEDGVWRTTLISRADGSDAVATVSDEFHLLPLDGNQGLTVADFAAEGAPRVSETDGVKTVEIAYRPRHDMPVWAPRRVTVTYTLANEPYLRKSILLDMPAQGIVDRLQVERFSCASPAERGGRGEPIFIGPWFFGVEYPAAYSRHSNNFEPRPYAMLGNYSWIGLDGRDEEYDPRDGLVTFFHFPGKAKKDDATGRWTIQGKTAVCGIGRPDDTIETAFLAYLDTIRRPVRSFIHYNNWYDGSGKNLSIENFVHRVTRTFQENLKPYGVSIDAMVPDSGWQYRGEVYGLSRGHFPEGMKSFTALSDTLKAEGTELGIWMAINGYTMIDTNWAKSVGIEEAQRNERFQRFQRYFCIAAPNYNAAIKKRLPELIRGGDLAYIKHDFNDMCCTADGHGHLPTDRHGHEASVDTMTEILAMEREIRPDIYQNITNWIWFSPWWLMHGNNLWMLAGDHGVNRAYPQISTRKMAITYRDAHLYNAWGDPKTRPLVPISHLMTHGIIYADRCRVEQPGDTLRDFSDYVVMYYGRGLQLKEWYITTTMMTPERWKVLGRATRWSEENLDTLAKTVYVGGNPAMGEAYGYVALDDDRGILTARNATAATQTLIVPIDRSTLYGGPTGRDIAARIVYPYVESSGRIGETGEPIELTIPPYTTMVLHLDILPIGESAPKVAIACKNTPDPGVAMKQTSGSIECRIIPAHDADERFELMIETTSGDSVPLVEANGQAIAALRSNSGQGWRMFAYDLRPFADNPIELAIYAQGSAAAATAMADGPVFSSMSTTCNVRGARLLLDRTVPCKPLIEEDELPWALAHDVRRETYRLKSEATLLPKNHRDASEEKCGVTDEELGSITAAKLRIRVFGSNGGQYAGKAISIDGTTVAQVPVNPHNDHWIERVVDLSAEALPKICRTTTIRVGTVAGDCYKFAALQLAVRTADGRWVTSSVDPNTHSSTGDWKFSEGQPFKDDGSSHPIRLEFAK